MKDLDGVRGVLNGQTVLKPGTAVSANHTTSPKTALFVSITDDLLRVSLHIMHDGNQVGWIELDKEQADHVIKNLHKFRSLIKNHQSDA